MTPDTEIERKYIIKNLPKELLPESGNKIFQGYLTTPDSNESIRLRKKGNKYYKTRKSKGNLIRGEREEEIDARQFDTEWEHVIGNKVIKTRYEIPYRNHVIELDVFESDLEGLVIAEVEFESLQESNLFLPPDWFGAEITSYEEFKNSNLAFYGLPKKFLDRTNW